ncbi:MAG: FkbM family methyltransferase [Flavobacteriales bacterium]
MLTLLKIINRLFLRRKIGNHKHAHVFDYLQRVSMEGKSFGFAGSVARSGEKKVIEFVQHKIGNGTGTIFDVGANVGQYQRLFLKNYSNPNISLHSFEPSPSTYTTLENNKKDSRISNYNVGLGETASELKLFRNQPGSPLASLYKKGADDYYHVKNMDDFELVKIKTLDTFCQENKIDKIDYLKMDVEGHELFVLLGAKHMLNAKKISMIQFEFGPANIDSKTYFRDFYRLLGNDYIIYRVMKTGISPIQAYSELEEVFLPINYFAVLKSMN